MGLNTIKGTGNWGGAASDLNNNFASITAEIEKLKAANVKFKGYYTTELTLKAAYPSPTVGDNAWVGDTYPGTVYECKTAGTWSNTTKAPSTPSVQLADYATKNLLDVRTTEYNVSVQHPTSGLDGTNKYTLSGAIALVPLPLRTIGLKCSFLNVDGTIETWEYQGGTYGNISSWIEQVRRTELNEVKDNLVSLEADVSTNRFGNSILPFKNLTQNFTLKDLSNYINGGNVKKYNIVENEGFRTISVQVGNLSQTSFHYSQTMQILDSILNAFFTVKFPVTTKFNAKLYLGSSFISIKNIEVEANKQTTIELSGIVPVSVVGTSSAFSVYFQEMDSKEITFNVSPIFIYSGEQREITFLSEEQKDEIIRPVKGNIMLLDNKVESVEKDITAINTQAVDLYPYLDGVTTQGKYVNLNTGILTDHALWKITELSEIYIYNISTTLIGGKEVALIAYFNNEGEYLGYQEKGTEVDTVVYEDLKLNIPDNTAKIIISTNTESSITIKAGNLSIATKKFVKNAIGGIPQKIQTWGDSLTFSGRYQQGIADTFDIPISSIKNAGIASDLSMHVRNRFIDYFTKENPYVGTGTYTVPSFEERQTELKESFFLFWIGTNNLINQERSASSLTTGSEAYTALQPNPDFKIDRMYARSYVDRFLDDFRQILEIIPHNNWAIIGGHGGFSSETDMYKQMMQIDSLIADMYPRNFVNIRLLMLANYNYQLNSTCKCN